MRSVVRRYVLALSGAALGVSALVAPNGAVAGPPPPVPIPGSVSPYIDPIYGTTDLGPSGGSKVVDLGLILNLKNPSAAESFVRSVSDPRSDNYHHYLSAARYTSRFAPSAGAVNDLVKWLTSKGMSITNVPSDRLWVRFSGTVDQVNAAFQTSLHDYNNPGLGGNFRAAATPALVPLNLKRPLNSGTTDLPGGRRTLRKAAPVRNYVAAHAVVATPVPPSAAFVNGPTCSKYWDQKWATTLPTAYGSTQPWVPCGYTPLQYRSAYGVSSLVKHGINGSGVTVAIVDAYNSATILNDANTYAANRGEPTFVPGQFNEIAPAAYTAGYNDLVNGNQCSEQGWYGEESLDVQAVHGMAPGANVLYVGAASCFDLDLAAALHTIIDGHLAQIITNSWGGVSENDPINFPDLYYLYHSTFIQAAAEGIGIFFSSGDYGDQTAYGFRTVDAPANDPLVTAVGGTSLGVGKRGNYLFETGWGTTKSAFNGVSAWTPAPPGNWIYGGGGGTSQVFAQPWYQRGVVPKSISQYFGAPSARSVPDIAMDADPSTGMLVGQTQTFTKPDSTTYVAYGEYRIGGTSLASPLMAGMEALADQAAGFAHGFANPAIYQQAGSGNVRDIVPLGHPTADVRQEYVDQTSFDPNLGYVDSLRSFDQTQTIFTRRGYDDVTGVGTPNGAGFVYGLGRDSHG
jgi:subtilase family serine protease